MIICNRGSITGTLSELVCGEGSGSDAPRTLRLASDARGFSYGSGDEVIDVSRKWTPLDLTSEETGGRGMLVCPGIVRRFAVVVLAGVNERGGGLVVCSARCQSYICLQGTLGTSLGHQARLVETRPSAVEHSRVVVVWRW